MVSYQDFVKKARERFDKRRAHQGGRYQFTEHSRFKMQQYNLSEQRVTRIIRAPKRTEEGIAHKTIAVMQPGTVKRDAKGKETWTQEIWVMYQLRRGEANHKSQITIPKQITNHNSQNPEVNQSTQLRIISAWRYPGMSPKRNPIPEEILRELETGETFDEE
ncbi:MAG: hypothetical protein WAU28_02590 [Candidatus Moraniibacteriota bacterium]